MHYDVALAWESLPTLLAGTVTTFVVLLPVLVLGLLISIPVALARLERGPGSLLAAAYIVFFRGVPSIVLLYLIYSGLPQFSLIRDTALWTLFSNAYFCAWVGLTLTHSGYMGEIVRGGLAAVPPRTIEAAQALGLSWPATASLRDYQRTLDPADPRQAALMLEIRRASPGASYQPYQEGVVPWHEAMAATYAHATAPLRRLADRYVVRCALAIANGQPVPQAVTDAFARLPKVMGRGDARASQINHAAIDLAEAVMLRGREGETFDAVVTDFVDHGVRVQLADLAVVANVNASGLRQGDRLKLRLVSADPDQRRIVFEPATPA